MGTSHSFMVCGRSAATCQEDDFRAAGDTYAHQPKKLLQGVGVLLAKTAAGCRRRRVHRRANNSENNKLWLLAEEAAGDVEMELDGRSVHSSFRFSFGSQVEAEERDIHAAPCSASSPSSSSSTATVLLLVNLEDGGAGDDAVCKGQQWRRLESIDRSISPVAAGLVRFAYADIFTATRGFSRGRELGRGPQSRVYRGRMGRIGRRRAVAVKRVDGRDKESAKAFVRELMIASSLRHHNVVPLLGFCVDLEGIFLVYKYVSGGSLDRHLHCHEKKALPWQVRYKVAIGVAQAVEYLHYGTDKCVVHRDIKPSNILLSSKKSPKLCDFGLATWIHGPSLPFLCKSVKGTFGYLAPEYFQHGKLSDKTDVYAFGVVLLELISGRKAIDQSRPQGDENLVLWAKPLLQQGEAAMEKLVDPRLNPGSYSRSEMSRMVCTAAACVTTEETGRPNIDQVIGMLLGEETCSDWSIFRNNTCLTGYGSQFHETHDKSAMRGHLALAMLGVSDTEEDDIYSR